MLYPVSAASVTSLAPLRHNYSSHSRFCSLHVAKSSVLLRYPVHNWISANARTAGASYNGVKIRCSKMRMEMKKQYEELGWEIPEPTNGKAAKPKAEPKGKRKAGSAEAGDSSDAKDAEAASEEVAAPKPKKLRAKKGKGEAAGAGSGGGDDGEAGGVEDRVKAKRQRAKKSKADGLDGAQEAVDTTEASSAEAPVKAKKPRAKKGGGKKGAKAVEEEPKDDAEETGGNGEGEEIVNEESAEAEV